MAITWSKIDSDNGPSLTIIFEDGKIQNIPGSHPNFKKILVEFAKEEDGYEEVVRELADTITSIKNKLQRLSERFTTDGSQLFFDGDPIVSALSTYIIRLVKAENDGEISNEKVTWRALIAFLEKLYQNPNKASQDSLYNFISNHGLTIRGNGDFVAYKGINDDYSSRNRGEGVVDGVAMVGALPNRPGSVLEIARSKVDSNANQGCAVGLHAGTLSYASWWGERVVAVSINPRDVVSVPNDSEFQKLRTCRYEVLTDIEKTTEARATVGAESKVFWNDNDSEILETLNEALDNEIDVTIEYTSKDGSTSTRTVDVERIDNRNVYTYDLGEDEYRTFTISRIKSAVLENYDEDEEDVCGDCGCEDLDEDCEVILDIVVVQDATDESVNELIHDAIDNGELLRISYTAKDKASSVRLIEPVDLSDGRLEARLVNENNAVRTFLVDGITAIQVVDKGEEARSKNESAPTDVTTELKRVIAAKGKVKVAYRSSRGVVGVRIIAPNKIEGAYVHVTLPEENNEYRTLRLDRILSIG